MAFGKFIKWNKFVFLLKKKRKENPTDSNQNNQFVQRYDRFADLLVSGIIHFFFLKIFV